MNGLFVKTKRHDYININKVEFITICQTDNDDYEVQFHTTHSSYSIDCFPTYYDADVFIRSLFIKYHIEVGEVVKMNLPIIDIDE